VLLQFVINRALMVKITLLVYVL